MSNSKVLSEDDIKHFNGCSPNYPERNKEEPRICRTNLQDDYYALVCIDCGSSVDNMPPEDDSYWDDVRGSITGRLRKTEPAIYNITSNGKVIRSPND